MKEIVTPRGILKYRMPNIVEVYKLITDSGIFSGVLDDIQLRMNIISSMSPMIDYSGIEGVHSYDELLLDIDEMLQPLSDIADELVTKIVTVLKKKNI